MHDTAICPYYGKNEDACDIGCGYITSHDASMIIKFCSSKYADCQKYLELSERLAPEKVADYRPRPALPASLPETGLAFPAFGLFSLGATTALYALDQLPLFNIDLRAMALIFFIGALGQITSGLSALKKNPPRAVAFTGFGLFWLSILALDVLPRSGYGELPGQLSMVGYLAVWGLFGLILSQGMESLPRTCRLVFTILTAFILCLAVAQATDSTAARHVAALLGLASGLPGIASGLYHCWRETLQSLQPEPSRSSRVR